jgi:glycosyltransferase involved in cell wall biosynthesis
MISPAKLKSVVILDPLGFSLPYDRAFCAGLAAVGLDITLVGPVVGNMEAWDNSSFEYVIARFRNPGQRTKLHDVSRKLGKFIAYLRYMVPWIRLLLILRRRQPDVLHVQWLPVPRIDIVFMRIISRFVPVVLTAHDVLPYMAEFNQPTLRAWNRILSLADHIITHTEISANELAALGVPRERATRIAHGPLGLEGLSASVRLDDQRPTELVSFLQFGWMKEYKGIDVLVRAVSLMPIDVRVRCRFVVAGKPAMDLHIIEELIHKCAVDNNIVLLARYFDDKEAAALLAEADVFVFPYRQVHASGVLSLVLNMDRPIVATSVGCFREMLVDGRHGFVVPPEDPAALADALTKLARDETLRRMMSRNVRQLRKSLPGWHSIAEETTKIYRKVLEARSSVAAGWFRPVGS